MTDMKAEFDIGPNLPLVYLILGPARSGKDTAGDELARLTGLQKGSTSEEFFHHKALTRDKFAAMVGDDWRLLLAEWMAQYNRRDGSGCKLYKEMFGRGVRIFTGIRRLGELDAFYGWLRDRADARVWWVDAELRNIPEDPSIDFGQFLLKVSCLPYTTIDSNAGVPELLTEVRKAWEEQA